jgi:hypothetical protein
MVSPVAFQLFVNFVVTITEIIHEAFANQPQIRSHQVTLSCRQWQLRESAEKSFTECFIGFSTIKIR